MSELVSAMSKTSCLHIASSNVRAHCFKQLCTSTSTLLLLVMWLQNLRRPHYCAEQLCEGEEGRQVQEGRQHMYKVEYIVAEVPMIGRYTTITWS